MGHEARIRGGARSVHQWRDRLGPPPVRQAFRTKSTGSSREFLPGPDRSSRRAAAGTDVHAIEDRWFSTAGADRPRAPTVVLQNSDPLIGALPSDRLTT